MMNEWFVTDGDCMQHCKQLSEKEFQFVQMVWLDTCSGDEGYPDKEYTVMSAYVDLNDYSQHDIDCAIFGYYDSVEDMKESYGVDNVDQIIAECIFEEMTDGSATTYGMMTKESAMDVVNEYIKKY